MTDKKPIDNKGDQPNFDDVLKRMLETPPDPKKKEKSTDRKKEGQQK